MRWSQLSLVFFSFSFLTVVLDEADIALIEFFEAENSEAYYPNSTNTQYQQVHRTIQPSNNLPAFETLFHGKRNQNNVNRLHVNQMTDSEDDEESNNICRKGKRGK